jgi:hypothetical protein
MEVRFERTKFANISHEKFDDHSEKILKTVLFRAARRKIKRLCWEVSGKLLPANKFHRRTNLRNKTSYSEFLISESQLVSNMRKVFSRQIHTQNLLNPEQDTQ